MQELVSPPPGHVSPPPAWLYLVLAGVANALNLTNVLLHPLVWLPTTASAAGPRCPEWLASRSAGSQLSNLLHSLLETQTGSVLCHTGAREHSSAQALY